MKTLMKLKKGTKEGGIIQTIDTEKYGGNYQVALENQSIITTTQQKKENVTQKVVESLL